MDTGSEATKLWLQTQRTQRTRAAYPQAWGDFLSRSQRQTADVTQEDVIAYRNILARAEISNACPCPSAGHAAAGASRSDQGPRVGRANRYTLTDIASHILTEYLTSRRRVSDSDPLPVAHEGRIGHAPNYHLAAPP